VFSQEKIQTLSEHLEYDYKINIEPRKQPPSGPIYKLSEAEFKVSRDYLNNMMASGKISRSTLLASALILFVPKPNGTLRLCIDYHGLNKVTLKNRYPLSLMSELRDRLAKAKYFTKLDLKDGFYLIRIAEGG
jgi:hypothetical protein